MSVNETVVEAKMCTFTLESTHFIFNKCPIYTHDGASAKFSLTHVKRITVWTLFSEIRLLNHCCHYVNKQSINKCTLKKPIFKNIPGARVAVTLRKSED